MPADEVTHGTDVETSRVRTGPRHAAPKKPLFTRIHMPAGKAIAMAAMPTAVLMGMGFTASLAIADNNSPSPSQTMSADEYKACVAALEEGASPSASPSPSASADESSDSDNKTDDSNGTDGTDGKTDDTGSTPKPSPSGDSSDGGSSEGGSSSDSGSDDKAEPTPSPSASASKEAKSPADDAGTPSPSASEGDGGLLDTIGDTLEDILTGGGDKSTSDTGPTPSPSASTSAPASGSESGDSKDGKDTKDSESSDPVKETTEKVTDKATDTVRDTVEGTTDKASEAAKSAEEAAKDAGKDTTDAATATPSPSASATPDADDCPIATDDEGGIDNKIRLPDDHWTLNASWLRLKGADYQGVVEVKTANGTVKKVLKYVITDGTDIGDLHQSVKDPHSGKTYHVQAGKGTTSTISDGTTVMYTEKISGYLFGLIWVSFDPDNPPPLNIPFIYFSKVTVQQAGQFGGTLHVPGLHQYATSD